MPSTEAVIHEQIVAAVTGGDKAHAPRLSDFIEKINAHLPLELLAKMFADCLQEAKPGSREQQALLNAYAKLMQTNEQMNPPETDEELSRMAEEQLVAMLGEYDMVPKKKPEAKDVA